MRTDASHPRDASRRTWVLAAGIVLAVLVMDQLTKIWAVAALSDAPIHIAGDSVRFLLARNPGGAFSFLSTAGVTPLLAILAIGVTVFLVRLMARNDDVWLTLALALVLGGALGNLSDRIFRSPGLLRGRVIDFVAVGRFPVFNVADASLTVGIAILLVCSFRRPANV
ncbi:MAG TPA: signal peptidase II [Acidimicrobiia bacterium]|nr:signal peptidase II [Acidimicrobiia bacterium]